MTRFLNLLLMAVLLSVPDARAISEEEHKSHHPQQSGKASTKSSPSGGMAGMGEMMDEMMKGMAPKQKDFYPSLMSLPRMSEEERADLSERAHERMKSGAAIMNRAFVELTKGAESNDYQKMKDATADIREGLARFESGVATHEALNKGASPEQIGLSWFKKNLNLSGGREAVPYRHSLLDLGWFHLFAMFLLAAFTISMIFMYFFKMRRAAALLARLKAQPAASPSSKPWKGQLKIASIYQETPTVKTFKLVSATGGDLPFTYLAGQFLTLAVSIDGKPIKRSYTISSHPCDRRALEVTVKREESGLVSRYMHDVLHEGDLIDVEAAFGKLTFSGVGGDGIVLIGGGVGITPLMSVLRCLIACGMKNKIYLIYACKSLQEFVFREEIRQLAERNHNLKVVVAVDQLDGSYPGAFQGRLTKEAILAATPDISGLRIHLCGPPAMMQAIRGILNDLKVPEDHIKTEAFGPPVSKPKMPEQMTALRATSTKNVVFKKSGKSLEIREGETILELAETSGIDIPFSCRTGTCGTCKVKLLSGQVAMEVDDSLTDEDKANNLILACQAKPLTDVVIEEP